MAIIRCPECKEQISSMALTCPHCGIRIKGHIRQCPDCKEWIRKNNATCKVCGSSVSIQHDDEAYTTRPIDSKPITPKKKVNNSCLLMFMLLLILTTIIAGIAYGLYKYHQHQVKTREAILEELSMRIREDEKANAEHMRMAQEDSTMWKKTFRTKTIDATENYIKTYPEGIFINEAYMLLEELKRRKVSENDQSIIRHIVEEELNSFRKQNMKKKEKDVIGLHYQIVEKLDVTRKYINRDSFVYIANGRALETINRSDPKKANSNKLKLSFTISSDKKLVESSIDYIQK